MSVRDADLPAWMIRGVVLVTVVGTLACSESKPAAPPPPASLPAGPVPVTLASIDSKRLRELTSVAEFVVLDSHGKLRWGKPASGPTPWAGKVVERTRNIGASVQYDYDAYGKLSRESSATSVILADASTPARILLRDGIQAYPYKPVALAASAANLAVPYQFGEAPWEDYGRAADLTLRADKLESITTKPHTVLLQFTDATTTGELLSALTAIADTGAERVRLHRMMGWGEIGPSDIVSVQGPEADDDRIEPGEPATVTVKNVRVDETLTAQDVEIAMVGVVPRFRYCYEKGQFARPTSIELSFDVAANGDIQNATANGPEHALASCVAGAVFDWSIATGGIRGTGHATASVGFRRDSRDGSAPSDSKPITGFWCWRHQNGRRGMCERDKEECELSSATFNRLAPSSGEPANTNSCEAQKAAWTGNGPNTMLYPTKTLCSTLEMSDKCQQVR